MSPVPAILAEEVRDRGFAIWPGFASPKQCETLSAAAGILANGEHAHHYPKSTRVWDLYQYEPVFVDIVTHPGLADLLDELLGRYYLLSDYSLNVVNPGQPIDDWHIDYPYNEMPTIVTGGILGLQCVLALDHFTEDNGATRLVPGSHRPPRRPGEPSPYLRRHLHRRTRHPARHGRRYLAPLRIQCLERHENSDPHELRRTMDTTAVRPAPPEPLGT